MSVKPSTSDLDWLVENGERAIREGGPEIVERTVARVEAKQAVSPPGFDPDHPFFAHEPAEPTGESKTATETDDYLYR